MNRKVLLANTFGTLGYFSCILSWGWVALLYLPLLLENKFVEDFLIPTPSQEAAQTPLTIEPSPVTLGFALIVTVAVLIVTIIMLVRLPSAVAKTGKTVTTKAANSAAPLVTRSHQLPPAKKKRLTANLIKLVKLLLVLLPVVAAACGTFFTLPLPESIVVLTSCILALLTLVWFSIQYLVAQLLRVDLARLV